MTYFDTNVLVYFTIDQDSDKLEKARCLIFDAIKNDSFFISPLVVSEYIFILSKLKILNFHDDKVELFLKHTKSSIDTDLVKSAYELCKNANFCKNINDVIHLKIAEEHCDRLVTFDSDFKKLKKHTKFDISILT